MLTLKNAMNAGQHLLNEHHDEHLILDIQWTIPYQQFDGTLSHLDGQGVQVYHMAYRGLYETFEAVRDYAHAHEFSDTWQVADPPAR